jgi:hypothetical protein
MAKPQATQFTCRRAHKKHLQPELTPEIQVRNGFIQLDTEAVCWLPSWMEGHLTFKELHNRQMEKARAADARLQTLTMIYRV